jgi:hypothetical protein
MMVVGVVAAVISQTALMVLVPRFAPEHVWWEATASYGAVMGQALRVVGPLSAALGLLLGLFFFGGAGGFWGVWHETEGGASPSTDKKTDKNA